MKLYRHPLSGHCHRVELFLSILGIDAELVEVDLAAGEHKQPAFLARNRFGQVPVLEDDGHVVSDSNAILVYLAQRYDETGKWLPKAPAQAAAAQRWLSAAAGPMAYGPCAARLVNVFGAPYDHDEVKARAHELLTVMEDHLAGQAYLTGTTPTIADLANYAYLAHAPEGDVDLGGFANVRAWLARIEALRGFVPMQATPVGLAA